jgi:23S rRNA pseudouridine955/2504/2580 synthase
MSGVQTLTVSEDEGESRLDRWLKRRFPQITQGAIEKLCRTGQLRVDGGRVKANTGWPRHGGAGAAAARGALPR